MQTESHVLACMSQAVLASKSREHVSGEHVSGCKLRTQDSKRIGARGRKSSLHLRVAKFFTCAWLRRLSFRVLRVNESYPSGPNPRGQRQPPLFSAASIFGPIQRYFLSTLFFFLKNSVSTFLFFPPIEIAEKGKRAPHASIGKRAPHASTSVIQPLDPEKALFSLKNKHHVAVVFF